MKVVGFDGKEVNWNFSKNYVRKQREGKSSLHKQCLQDLLRLFPNRTIYEECTLPGSSRVGRSALLYADFFIPDIPAIIEVHGKQHYEYCPFFHKTKMAFYKAKARDRDKIEWCKMNDIKIVVLPYNEKDSWKQMIVNSI